MSLYTASTARAVGSVTYLAALQPRRGGAERQAGGEGSEPATAGSGCAGEHTSTPRGESGQTAADSFVCSSLTQPGACSSVCSSPTQLSCGRLHPARKRMGRCRRPAHARSMSSARRGERVMGRSFPRTRWARLLDGRARETSTRPAESCVLAESLSAEEGLICICLSAR